MDKYPDFDLPAELVRQPLSPTALVGLDVVNNATHKTIWEMFSVGRKSDRPALEFVLFPLEFTLPVSKPKKISYEWYVPKGIIKTNWMNKHLRCIPSVIVFFFELDWDDSRWSEKKLECASHIRTLRSSIGERSTIIAVVLIQKSVFPVVTEENVSTEKASELCSTCDINPKLLLLLHAQTEHLQGYINRLENAFNDLSQNYYSQEIRSIKLHKDNLTKNPHQYLFVRHQFKLGFFNEMKHDPNIALKHYTLANSNLLEVRMNDSNLYEVKTVASFITYKLCKIYFALNQPRDAISQFNTHIDRFRAKTGPLELLFEHYSWLSKQFQLFADLFEETTRKGLPAVQTRHPGFYYEQAAQYALQRKNLVNDLCKDVTLYPENDPLVGWERVEFYGQRPWRINNRTDQMDLIKEQAAICALQYRERFIINHSTFIISYLGSAISQFKQYRSPRKRRYLAVQMAEEYCHCNEHGKALTLFSHMLWEYRNDKWWELTIDLTKKALNCAYLTACLQEYVDRSVEAAYLFPDEEKLRIMNNIQSVIQKTHPAPELQLPEAQIAAASELWSKVVQQTSTKSITVDMYSVTSFILCKATFGQANCDSVDLEIWLMNDFPSTLTFSSLVVSITGPNESFEVKIFEESAEKPNMLEINPKEFKRIPFTFVPSVTCIGHEIQLKYILLTMGSKVNGDRVINLRFTGVCDECDILERTDSFSVFNGFSTKIGSTFTKLESKLSVTIKPKASKLELDIKHAPPILLSEWFPIDVVLVNGELSTAKSCELKVIISSPAGGAIGSNGFDPSTNKNSGEIFDTINGTPYQFPCVFQLNDLEKDASVVKRLYFRSNSVEISVLIFRVQYLVSDAAGTDVSLTKETSINLSCVSVFEMTASFLSNKCENLSKIYAKMPVLMRMQVDCVSPWPIYVENTSFKLESENISWEEKSTRSYLENKTLNNKEVGAELVSFVPKDESKNGGESLGVFVIYWRRDNHDASYTVRSEVNLPQIKVDPLPVFIEADISSPGWQLAPLSVKLTLKNNSDQLISFDVSMEHHENDGFIFSGWKQASFTIAPGFTDFIRYNLIPLKNGQMPLPFIKLSIHSDLMSQNDLNELIKRTLPQSLFVMPQKIDSSDQPHGSAPVITDSVVS